jgi:hypothetical protein
MDQSKVKVCLQALLDLEAGLSEWEVSFVEDMSLWEKINHTFTPNQINKIIEIYDKNC